MFFYVSANIIKRLKTEGKREKKFLLKKDKRNMDFLK